MKILANLPTNGIYSAPNSTKVDLNTSNQSKTAPSKVPTKVFKHPSLGSTRVLTLAPRYHQQLPMKPLKKLRTSNHISIRLNLSLRLRRAKMGNEKPNVHTPVQSAVSFDTVDLGTSNFNPVIYCIEHYMATRDPLG